MALRKVRKGREWAGKWRLNTFLSRQFVAPEGSHSFSGWIFLAALIYAPWAYGGTTDSSITGINSLLGIALGLRLLELVGRRRWPVISLSLIITTASLLILGWLAAFNPIAAFDTEREVFEPVRSQFQLLPSSVDMATSVAWMVRVSLLLGSIVFVADLSRRPEWILRLWVTVGIAGGSIALLGLSQRATGAILPFWEYQPGESSSFFATYYYHANAGAFLNLALPPTAGLAIRAFERSKGQAPKAIWLAATVLLVAAALTNTSRAAQFLALIAIGAVAIGAVRRLWGRTVTGNWIIIASTLVIASAVGFALLESSGITASDARWRRAGEEIPRDIRWQAYATAARAIPEAGWSGFGPGTFQAFFPHYWRSHNTPSSERWEFLHQDYLQAILEWGGVGAACWATIFFGGIAAGCVGSKRLRKLRPAPRMSQVLPFILIALGTVALHSLVDFPLQIASLQLYTATYVGICWGAWKQGKGEAARAAAARQKRTAQGKMDPRQ